MAERTDEKHTPLATVINPDTQPRKQSSSRLTTVTTISITLLVFLIFAMLFAMLYAMFFASRPVFDPYQSLEDSSATQVSDSDSDEDPYPPFFPIKRYSLEYGRVACWQNEGVWIAKLGPVEMISIGLDRFHDTDRSLDQADEDAFCARLRTYGASFWKLPPRWPENVNWCETLDSCVEPDKNVQLELGFTENGGVWMLDTSQGWDKYWPQSLGLHNAVTMEERCTVLKDLGATYCESMQACPETAALLEVI